MNACTNTPLASSSDLNRIAQASGVVLASLLVSTSAFALDAPNLADLHVYGAQCIQASDYPSIAPVAEDMPAIERLCKIADDATVFWQAVPGADAYVLTIWGDYGHGFELVSQYDTVEPKVPVSPGNANAYAFSIQSVDSSGELSESSDSIVLENALAHSPSEEADPDHADDGSTPQEDPNITELEAELDAAYDDLHDALDTIDRLAQQNAQLEAALANAKDSLIAQDEEMQNLKAENGALKAENDAMKSFIKAIFSPKTSSPR